jgi:hypothetical protein
MNKIWCALSRRLSGLKAWLRFYLWLRFQYVPMAGGDTQTLALADAILKDLYIGPMVEQLNQKTYLLDQIERTSEHVDHTGRRAVIPLRYGRNTGRGSRADNSNLPVAGRQKTVDAIVSMRYHYIGIELSHPTIEATKKSEGAFLSALEMETEGASDDLKKDLNRQLFGTGDGLLATVNTTTNNSTTVMLDSVQYLQVGDPIDIRVKSNGNTVVANESVVTRTGGATKQITVAAAVTTTASTDGVYLAGARNNESDGLRNITDDAGTVHSVNGDTAGNEWWRGKEKTAGGAVAGESLFEQLADAVGGGGRAEVEVFLTSRGIRRRLADTYQSQKRFNDAKAVDVHGGYSAIMVNEVPVVADDDCPVGFAFGINRKAFKWYELMAPDWLDQGNGQILTLKDATTAGQKMNVYQGWLAWYACLGCDARNRNGRIVSAADDNPE